VRKASVVRAVRDAVAKRDDGDVAEALLAEVSRFVSTIDGRTADRDGRFSPHVLDGARSLGLFALTIPAEHGGLGLALPTACAVIDTLATVDRSFAIAIGLHAGLGTRGIVDLGSPSLRDRWLPRMASGECVGAFAATEAGAGSDLTAMRTVLREGPGGFVLDGEKSFVTNGGFAGLFTVLTSSPSFGGQRGHTLVCVPADSPGVEIGREEDKLGIRASSTVTVRFDGVRVPADHVLGQPGRGIEHAHGVLAWGRTLMASGCVGTARAALAVTLAYVQSRRQFGRPIGSFAASREHIAGMASRVLAMDAFVRHVAEQPPSELGALSPFAKVYCSEEAFAVCDQAVQLHGALGFLEPTGVARMLRDCRITRIFEGANDVLLVRLGAARVAAGGTSALDADGNDATEAYRAAVKRLDGALAWVRAHHGVRVVRRQTILQHLARAEMYLRAARAVSRVAATRQDAELAAFTTDDLVARAGTHIGAVTSAEAREERVARLTDALYGHDVPTHNEGLLSVSP